MIHESREQLLDEVKALMYIAMKTNRSLIIPNVLVGKTQCSELQDGEVHLILYSNTADLVLFDCVLSRLVLSNLSYLASCLVWGPLV